MRAKPRQDPVQDELEITDPLLNSKTEVDNTIVSLTGIRFYAAFAVFVSHMYHFRYFGLPDFLTPVLAGMGHLGVSVFYVLSGFVLCVRYWKSLGSKASLKNFYVARLARIYPAFLATALMAVPIEMFSSSKDQILLTLGTNLSLTHCLLPETCGRLNDVGWSIGVEAAFYLLFPFILAILSKPWKLGAFLAAVGGYMLVMHHQIPGHFYDGNRFFLNRVPEFVFGVIAGALYLRNYRTLLFTSTPLQLGIWVAVLSSLLILMPYLLKAIDFEHHHYLLLMFPSSVLIYVLATAERDKTTLAMFTSSLAVFGGEISYSFYLVHNLLLRYLEHGLAILWGLDIKAMIPALQMGFALAMLIISLALSALLYQRIEKPFRKKIKKWLT